MASFRICLILTVFVVVQYSTTSEPEPMKINIYNQKNKMFQGDIANIPRNPKTRNALISRHWTNNEIPYDMSQVSAARQSLVQRAMTRISSSTCVRFVPRTSQFNYIRIRSTNDGCYSMVGMIGRGAQDLNLQDSSSGTCMTFDTVVHELLHAVGLYHEQSRYDRDGYITVQYANIEPDDRSQFDIEGPSTTNFFGTSYDFNSVMHYDQFAFSSNNRPTITVNSNIPNAAAIQRTMGNVQDVSPTDIIKVNRMYNCPQAVVQTVAPPPPPPTPAPTAPPPPICADASWLASFCSTYRNFCFWSTMSTFCRKTCNLCT